MDIAEKLKIELGQLLDTLEPPESLSGPVDTRCLLYRLASGKPYPGYEDLDLDFLLTRLEIGRKLFLAYDGNGRKAVDKELDDPRWQHLCILLILLRFAQDENDSAAVRLKACNAFFRLLDRHQPDFLREGSWLKNFMNARWNAYIGALPVSPGIGAKEGQAPAVAADKPDTPVATLPWTILFYESPIARAYLETIRASGLRPARIIHYIPARDVVSGKPAGRWLPKTLKANYLASTMQRKIHYWPGALRKKYPSHTARIHEELSAKLGFSSAMLSNAAALKPLESYCDDVEQVLCDSFGEPALHTAISRNSEQPVLFTGGGLVPASLLAIAPRLFLHVHPGYLPLVRGADCTLWSRLLYGRMSASCFYMAQAIDTGDLIKASWLPELEFDFGFADIDLPSRYRLVYAFIDPWVRAWCLRKVLHDWRTGGEPESSPQDTMQGNTFHFMHDTIRDAALRALLG